MSNQSPRLMLAATGSGAGKTTMTCAILQALRNRGNQPVSFKCGPDYIDPMFHKRALGASSHNLDLFLCGSSAVCELLSRYSQPGQCTVIEGVMGYYDGLGATTRASSYELSVVTKTPVVLVLNVRGMAFSAAAIVQGFVTLRPDSPIKAVLLNQCSKQSYSRLKGLIQAETGLPVLGYLPPMPGCTLESRHLGLVTADEVVDLQGKLAGLAEQAEQTIELDALLGLAETAPPLPENMQASAPCVQPIRVAIARDPAFCFYYEDALDLLQRLGVELVPFSPMEDVSLPEEIDGLLLGGGYPELYGRQLEQNEQLRLAVGQWVRDGRPCIAECGGFLYLHRVLQGTDGVDYRMAGAIEGQSKNAGKLRRFGYEELTVQTAGLLGGPGDRVPAHEFHHWDSDACGEAFTAQKPGGDVTWTCGYHAAGQYLGFPHLHLCGAPDVARRFVEQCRLHAQQRGDRVW